MSAIVRLAQIRGLMFDIEEEAGLTEISGLEREVLLACFLKGFSRPSVFRALKSLVNQNLLSHGKGLRGSYRLI
ncbi:MAG: hypothetical protein EBV97_16555 [Rhodobacteraceae bacterium]|nr:hypothetical protein [Paracoccaceae bacterium]